MEDRLSAADRAAQIGDFRTELATRAALGAAILYEMGRLDEALAQSERALELTKQLGAKRFEPLALLTPIRKLASDDRQDDALELADRAVTLSRETGVRFLGPYVLSIRAEIEQDRATQLRFLDEGEAILREGCVSHNYFHFSRHAMDIALSIEDWSRVERYADILRSFTKMEPVPWAEFFLSRASVLMACHRDPENEDMMAEAGRLRDEAVQIGLMRAWPALANLLSAHSGEGDR